VQTEMPLFKFLVTMGTDYLNSCFYRSGVELNLVMSSPVAFQSTGSNLLGDLMGVLNSLFIIRLTKYNIDLA